MQASQEMSSCLQGQAWYIADTPAAVHGSWGCCSCIICWEPGWRCLAKPSDTLYSAVRQSVPSQQSLAKSIQSRKVFWLSKASLGSGRHLGSSE